MGWTVISNGRIKTSTGVTVSVAAWRGGVLKLCFALSKAWADGRLHNLPAMKANVLIGDGEDAGCVRLDFRPDGAFKISNLRYAYVIRVPCPWVAAPGKAQADVLDDIRSSIVTLRLPQRLLAGGADPVPETPEDDQAVDQVAARLEALKAELDEQSFAFFELFSLYDAVSPDIALPLFDNDRSAFYRAVDVMTPKLARHGWQLCIKKGAYVIHDKGVS